MIKKIVICFLVSLVLAMMFSLALTDMYEPFVPEGNEVSIGSDGPLIHETKKLGLFDKLTFYFSDFTAFKSFLEVVWLWFIAMFVASTISVFLNRK